MAAHDNRTVICSVAFIDIVEYSKKSVEEQMRVKEQLNGLLVRALADVPAADRIILDTGDGVAISFLGEPEESLFFVLGLRDALAARNDSALRLRTGVNLGPVRLVRDINDQPNIIGDGINVAQRVMSFADAGQILVSRSFFDVISALSGDYARLFAFEGARTDKHVREHEVYSLGTAPAPRPAPRRSPGSTATGASAMMHKIGAATNTARVQVMRRPPLATALTVVLILLVAVVLRQALQGTQSENPITLNAEAPPQAPLRPEPSMAPLKAAPLEPAAELRVQPKTDVAREPPPQIRREKHTVAGAAGTARLHITPWGEVYVNGQQIGVTPPLREVPLLPGKHRIEVRNPGFASYVQVVEVNAGEEIRIRHQFR
jgi:class 3 adenylate cyclase